METPTRVVARAPSCGTRGPCVGCPIEHEIPSLARQELRVAHFVRAVPVSRHENDSVSCVLHRRHRAKAYGSGRARRSLAAASACTASCIEGACRSVARRAAPRSSTGDRPAEPRRYESCPAHDRSHKRVTRRPVRRVRSRSIDRRRTIPFTLASHVLARPRPLSKRPKEPT